MWRWFQPRQGGGGRFLRLPCASRETVVAAVALATTLATAVGSQPIHKKNETSQEDSCPSKDVPRQRGNLLSNPGASFVSGYDNGITTVLAKTKTEGRGSPFIGGGILPCFATTLSHCEAAAAAATAATTPSSSRIDEESTWSRLRVCGKWCATALASTPCQMDPRWVPCADAYCATTAGRWNQFVLQRPIVVSCREYQDGVGYPRGARPCPSQCLIPEIRPARYPQPTGVGLMCHPHSCRAASSPRYADNSDNGETPPPNLGVLQCPCNWFGSECTDDWMPLREIMVTPSSTAVQSPPLPSNRKATALLPLTLTVHDPEGIFWAADRPGRAVRINRLDPRTGTIHEMACAVARRGPTTNFHTTSLEIIVAQPDPRLDSHVRHIAEYLWQLATTAANTTTTPDNNKNKKSVQTMPSTIGTPESLFVNPVISGFYNGHYQYLMDYLHEHHKQQRPVDHVVLVATGAGLAGVMSILEALLVDNDVTTAGASSKSEDTSTDMNVTTGYVPRIRPTVHLYYGVRDASGMPYRDVLQQWADEGKLRLTIVDSADDSSSSLSAYVQHVVQEDWSARVHPVDSNKRQDDALPHIAWCVCGRLEVMEDIRRWLGPQVAATRLFLNI